MLQWIFPCNVHMSGSYRLSPNNGDGRVVGAFPLIPLSRGNKKIKRVAVVLSFLLKYISQQLMVRQAHHNIVCHSESVEV